MDGRLGTQGRSRVSRIQQAESAVPEARAGGRQRNPARGGYVLVEPPGKPGAVIIATGSEVALAVAAQKLLAQEGIAVRVVSMPSTTVFDRQDVTYRDSVLPPSLPTVAVEAGTTGLWHKYVGRTGE